VGHVALVVAWRPHYEQGHAVEHPDALLALFAIGFALVLAGEQITL
jgi:hypothetical protein